MFKTRKLVLAYKQLILSAVVFYVVAGMCLYGLVYVCRNPNNTIQAILGLVSNSVFYTDQLFAYSAWLLIIVLSMMLLPYLPLFVAQKFRLSHIAFPYITQFDHKFDLYSDTGSNAWKENSTSNIQPSGKSGIISGNKGMLMVADGKIMFVNKEFCQLTGYAPVDIIGKDFVEFILTNDLPKYAMLSRIPKDGIPSIFGMGFKCANSLTINVYLAGNKNSGVNPNDICLFYLKNKEEDLKMDFPSPGLSMDLFERTGIGCWIWDDKGLIYMNSFCQELIPIALGHLMKKPLLMLKAVDKSERRLLAGSLINYASTHSFVEEVKIESGDGSTRWFNVKIIPDRNDDGEIIRHIGVAYDITAQKQKCDLMERSCEMAIDANNNKTAFLANMSHEIRSPLNGILGFSELLMESDLPAQERDRYAEIIKNNGIALLSILTDIIDISKLESGKLKIQEKDFFPAELMNELQLQFANDPLVTHKGLTLKWLISDDIAVARLVSDPSRFRQVMVNLIMNALKYSNSGKIEVAAERWGDKAVFWIKDTGIGIPEESLPYIFDRFRQVSKTDSPNTNGFGLGLAICKALVELLGGNIWAESRAGHGSVFYFTIPYITPKLNEMSNVNSAETAFPYDWKGRTILIAEDIDFSFLYIEAVLRRTGARVLWAQNGREAIEMVKVNPGIDIALMDIHMPIMNGYDATREIAKIRPDLPVIAQTAFVLPDDVKACYAAGCAGYLAKPIRREQLLNTLTDYFEKIDQHAQVQAGNMPVYRSKIS